MNDMDQADLLEKISKALLEVPSKYGGVEEGVVINYDHGLTLKIQQIYQVDPEARKKIKNKWKDPDDNNEKAYWKKIIHTASLIVKSIAPDGIILDNFENALTLAAKELKQHKLSISHAVKNDIQIKDDIQGQIKLQMRKAIIGNNGSLFLGKFRILTTMHYKIIEDMIKNYDLSVVALVTSKDTKFSRDIRFKMLDKAFGNKIEIVEHSSGNIVSIINKAKSNINVILCGSDRVDDYEKFIQFNPELKVEEIPRTDEDISATKVIANINDEKYFKSNTPKKIHRLYKEIMEIYLK
jgi:nicotinic acid mononucleotide adenylyltransferase